MIIYNDDELCIICVVNYNTHARIVSIYGYIIYTFRGSVSRHENSSAITYNIIYCKYIPRSHRSLYNIFYWTNQVVSFIPLLHTPRSIQNEIIACSLVFRRKNAVGTILHEITKSNFVNAHLI